MLALVAACTGLVAGIVLAYANSITPGLRDVSDRTFVEANQRFNTVIQNPVFMALSNGALVCIVAALVLHLPADP